MEKEPVINQYLRRMLELGGSDLHLSINFPAKARVHGNIQLLDDDVLDAPRMEELMKEICLPAWRWTKFMETHDLDFAHEIPGLARFRCNYFYNYHGMGCVLRQIPSRILTMEELHLPKTLEEICNYQSGLVLVTGPTGSGKSTTLYAALSRLDARERNIMTIEDPIEYELEGIGQTQVNAKVDMTFARGLRAILRQDPDVVLVGEIRDGETAQIAVQASLTGHLVLSTLHTNSALGAISRLQDMGVEPFLLSTSLLAVMSQRLVRRLCPHCRQQEPANADTARQMEIAPGTALWQPRGCAECGFTGYRGRTGIHELLLVDDRVRMAIHRGENEVTLNQQLGADYITLRHAGRDKALVGITSWQEVLRVSEQQIAEAS